MTKNFTTNGITYKWDDGAERIEPNTLKSFFMDGHFDAPVLHAYPSITKVVINIPATIVFWDDGTKTVVKCRDGEVFDSEKGVAMAIAKKFVPKQYKRELTSMRNEALSKWAEKKQKKETGKKACWNCKYKTLSFWELPCINCHGNREWVPEEKKGR